MLKPKKNLPIKNTRSENMSVEKKLKQQNKITFRLRKVFKNKPYFINPINQELINLSNNNFFSRKLSIKVTPNNVFCNLKNISTNKTTKVGSSGKYKVKTSKKTLRFSCKIVLGFFLEEIKQEIRGKETLITLTAPIKLRKTILEQVSKYTQTSSVTVNFNKKKCFNGCRPPKKKRKKQKGLRLFK
jgi:ribosomal protein S11